MNDEIALLMNLVFKFLLMEPLADSYVKTGISLSSIPENILNYIRYFYTDFAFLWKVLIVIIVVCAGVGFVARSKQNKMVTLMVASVAIVVMFFLSFGVYIVMEGPLMDPRALYGVGVFISLLSIPLLSYMTKAYIGKAAVMTLGWVFVVFSFTYGNALDAQADYTDFRVQLVINDLQNLQLLDQGETLRYRIIGSEGYHDTLKKSIEEYPIIERMIPVLFADSNEWYWASYSFKSYYGLHAQPVGVSEKTSEENLIKSSHYHSIYDNGEYVLIELYDV